MNQVTKSRHSNYFNWNLNLDILLNSVPRKLILFKKYFTNALSSHILKNKDQSISLPCFISKINMLKKGNSWDMGEVMRWSRLFRVGWGDFICRGGIFFSIFLLYEFNKIVNFLLLVLIEGHCITSPTKSWKEFRHNNIIELI